MNYACVIFITYFADFALIP